MKCVFREEELGTRTSRSDLLSARHDDDDVNESRGSIWRDRTASRRGIVKEETSGRMRCVCVCVQAAVAKISVMRQFANFAQRTWGQGCDEISDRGRR